MEKRIEEPIEKTSHYVDRRLCQYGGGCGGAIPRAIGDIRPTGSTGRHPWVFEVQNIIRRSTRLVPFDCV